MEKIKARLAVVKNVPGRHQMKSCKFSRGRMWIRNRYSIP